MSSADGRSRQAVAAGRICWCETANSRIVQHFSGKQRRPALVVEMCAPYAAVYPCTTRRTAYGNSEWVGPVMSATDTFVVYGQGLFCVRLGDLHEPAAHWAGWKRFSQTRQPLIRADLRTFHRRYDELIEGDRSGPSSEGRLGSPLSALIPPELLALRDKPVPPPPPPVRPPVRRLSASEEFLRSIDSMTDGDSEKFRDA